MTRLACRLCAVASRRTRLLMVLTLNIIHPFIHGTPLDGGALDSMLAWANTSALVQD